MNCNFWFLVVAGAVTTAQCVLLGMMAFYKKDRAFDDSMKGLLLGAGICGGATFLYSVGALFFVSDLCGVLVAVSGLSTAIALHFRCVNAVYEVARPTIFCGWAFSFVGIVIIAKMLVVSFQEKSTGSRTQSASSNPTQMQGRRVSSS